uniref:Exonuclease domain-containing protein n=1 Tax=Palpitomonas bilix TaxID=652834 RepID=A0A7S3G5U3_9EUKA|mmetsp:Transcript_29112/g.74797  ORF Transcript_29112/g.74797 Transcript_29112/m.74797 type:complete len:610 (+) Transcript_29112:124-1953(+)
MAAENRFASLAVESDEERSSEGTPTGGGEGGGSEGEKGRKRKEMSPAEVKRKKKKEMKKKKKLIASNTASADDYKDVYGENAVASLSFSVEKGCGNDGRIRLRDVQNAVRWVLADGMKPNWVLFKAMPLIKSVVVLFLNNINPAEMEGVEESKRFTEGPIPLLQPGSAEKVYSPVSNFLQCSVKKTAAQIKAERTKAKAVSKKMQSKGREGWGSKSEVYLMTLDEMEDAGFPTDEDIEHTQLEQASRAEVEEGEEEGGSKADQAGVFEPPAYISTREGEHAKSSDRSLYAIDCEMVRTGWGSELARVTLVNDGEIVVYDEYVKPRNQVIDYLTMYSGITEESLRNVTKTVEDVRKELVEKFIFPHTVLCGHSLENDLKALRLVHERVVDTSIIYPHPRGLPCRYGLKQLAYKFLDRKVIQKKGAGGHDSAEDAITALQLVKKKVERGPSYGSNAEVIENLFDIVTSESVDNKAAAVASTAQLSSICPSESTASAVPAENLGDVMKKAASLAKTHQLVYAVAEAGQQEGEGKKMGVDEIAAQMYSSLPPNTFLVIIPGNRDLTDLNSASSRQRQAETREEAEKIGGEVKQIVQRLKQNYFLCTIVDPALQ